ncbi:hypothetical protein BS47DRAFT_1343904 [Hydnum rufescens UP504]|uniref:Glycine cleavage system P protein n=1 Tax=Hydnum rufescens UP504 TaxID=1448309 RepID=A0A9P6AXT1_9AGAM|nr:hypothetical protein BS47DRAFT_1343904 [Hydnum rufescens UP504]
MPSFTRSVLRAVRAGTGRAHRPIRPMATGARVPSLFDSLDTFTHRHVGPDDKEADKMLAALGYSSMDHFIQDAVPAHIRIDPANVSDEAIPPLSESELLLRAGLLAAQNKVHKSYIGMGYHTAVVPPVILRNVMENPAWYTQYTPYQPEISQGRLESLINYQTMVTSLTGLDISNASLLDEGTAAAEAMVMAFAAASQKKKDFFIDTAVAPQTVSVLRTRAKGFGINLIIGNASTAFTNGSHDICGILVQYPDVNGLIRDFSSVAQAAHDHGAIVVAATDLLALTLLKPPGEWGADIALGNSARFGVPAGYGGPHAAFFSVTEALKRKMPGRLIGLSKDVTGQPAYRLALQTREQHIRREKATSNICTSQALLANMAAMYAVYHGAPGLRAIATKVHFITQSYFDALTINVDDASALHQVAEHQCINLRRIDAKQVGVTVDESVTPDDLVNLINVFAIHLSKPVVTLPDILGSHVGASATISPSFAPSFARTSQFLQHPVFNTHHSETEMLRYIHHLQSKDLSLVHGMIPLGSCTMKLNSTSSMIPVTYPGFGNIHPFAPIEQAQGYQTIIKELEEDLCRITGFHSCSLQPNSGAAGEYTGLSVIRAYHESRNEPHRNICLIPISAHGTNPASAVMAGLRVVPIKSLADGSLDLVDLKDKAQKHKDNLAAFMITYPSTFGVFEDGVKEACDIIHMNGGQVYLDGANLNAQIGLTNPATCGGDVCHLNLHKTFSMPICVAEHLAPFLPGHPIVKTGGSKGIDAVSAAPFGSSSILVISWAYIKMLGGSGLSKSAHIALLNANYIAHRLKQHYSIRYKNGKGRVAHELLIDLAEFDKSAGLKVADFAKRLQPTESETLEELDRFCDAMIQIRVEVDAIIAGKQPRDNNLLKNAPHPMSVIALPEDKWKRPYDREAAVYPLPWLRERKFWPSVSRIDDAYGDLNLICECPSVEDLADS